MFGHRKHKRTLTGILSSAIFLAACGGLLESDEPAVNVWWLKPVAGAQPVSPAEKPVPLVLDLGVVPGLDNNRVLALSADAQLKPYAGARWADDAPELVASLIRRSLQATGRFDVAPGRAGKAASACALKLELNEFFADLDDSGKTRGVSVGIDGTCQCGTAPADALVSRAYVRAETDQMSAVVAAFQKALDQVTLDIINKINIIQ